VDRSDDLGDLFLRVARRLRHATFTALTPLGLSPHQSRALRIIGEFEPVRPSTIAERLHISPRSATDVLDALAQRGWVSRSPDPGDRRATLVFLTDAGRALADEVAALRHEESERLFGHLDANARAALRDTLVRLDQER